MKERTQGVDLSMNDFSNYARHSLFEDYGSRRSINLIIHVLHCP